MKNLNIPQISLNELSLYSHWPRRLLGLDDFSIKPKTKETVTREFNLDKWGVLLAQATKDEALSLNDVEKLEVDFSAKSPFFERGNFYLATEEEILERHLSIYRGAIEKLAQGETAGLVEMGAGFGSKILNLAMKQPFSSLQLFAGEFTESGQKLSSLLAERAGKKMQVGHCDFASGAVNGLDIPEGSVFFTSYAAHYVPTMPSNFCDLFLRFKPKAVIHFEPCFEHFSSNELHDLLCQRYFQLNDYTTNLVSVLKEAEKRKEIRILREEKKVIGGNPFLPISIIEWIPAG